MTVTSHVLASGPGWQVSDTICSNGPQDRRFEEQHRAASIAVVTQGTFQYRTRHGAAMLVPGSILLGNAGACFECGHEHGHGDRCLAFHLTPVFLEASARDVPGVKQASFAAAHLPPLPQLLPVLAEAEAARDERDGGALEELAHRLAGAVFSALADARPSPQRQSARDERRITAAVRRIEACADEQVSLTELAREAVMSPYHFLRVFRQVIGMTPHQFVLQTKLQRAAVRLRRTDDTISGIAYDAGFNDLSSFNRRFRRLMGATPSVYRAIRRSR
jgi:AraC-like DNA-binding protein